MIEPYVRRGGFRKPQLGAGAVRIAFGVGRPALFFTLGHKWRRGESKEVGPDATDWLQSSWVIGRQDDGGSRSRLTHHCSNSYGFIYSSRGHLAGAEWSEQMYRRGHTKSNLGRLL